MKDLIFNPDHTNEIKNWEDNSDNFADYSDKSDPNYKTDNDRIRNSINLHNTDWKAESDYFNYTRVNGKNIQGRTIKCSNKEYLKRIQHDKTNI